MRKAHLPKETLIAPSGVGVGTITLVFKEPCHGGSQLAWQQARKIELAERITATVQELKPYPVLDSNKEGAARLGQLPTTFKSIEMHLT